MHPGQYPPPRLPGPPVHPVPPGYHQRPVGPFRQGPASQHRQQAPRYRVRWVASRPPSAWPSRQPAAAEPYTGPPSYPVPPRWGFPNLVWRRPTAVPGTASDTVQPIERMRVLSRSVLAVLWTFSALAVVAGAAEIWRYLLLVQSRDSALNASVVAFSDGFVITAGLLTTILSLLPAGLSLWWLMVARSAAADEIGEEPSRRTWQVMVGMLVPGWNLVFAGPIVAELEHAVLRRSRTARPKPSRLVLWWWGAWVLNWLLLGLTIAWRFRDGVQAMADGVVLVALTDLSAAGLAVATALLVRRVSELLAPVDRTRLRSLRVLRVIDAPEPELRTARPTGSAR